MDFLYGPRSRVQTAAGPSELTMETTLFSNVCSAIRRETLEQHPFVDDIIMSEDQEWSRRMLLEGFELRYVADAVVRHSHPYTLRAGVPALLRQRRERRARVPDRRRAERRTSCGGRACATPARSCAGWPRRAGGAGCPTRSSTRARSGSGCSSARAGGSCRGRCVLRFTAAKAYWS